MKCFLAALFLSAFSISAQSATMSHVFNFTGGGSSPVLNTMTDNDSDPLVAARPAVRTARVGVGAYSQVSMGSFSEETVFQLAGGGFDPSLGNLESVSIDVSGLILNNHVVTGSVLNPSNFNYNEYRSTYGADIRIHGQTIASMSRRTQSIDCNVQLACTTNLDDNLNAVYSNSGVSVYTTLRNHTDLSLDDFLPINGGFAGGYQGDSFGNRSFGNPQIEFTDADILSSFLGPLSLEMKINNASLLMTKDCSGVSTLGYPTCLASIAGTSGQLITFAEDSELRVTYTYEAQVVPIPAAVWLFGSALGLLGWMRRKAS